MASQAAFVPPLASPVVSMASMPRAAAGAATSSTAPSAVASGAAASVLKHKMVSGKATGRAIMVAVIIALLVLPLLVFVLMWFSRPKAVDCVPATSWSEWSDCSAPCSTNGAPGWQYRTRPPAVMPTNGGAQCDFTDLVQSQTCNTDVPCGLPCVPDLNADKYPWSGCPACLPQGSSEAFAWRYVPPLQEAGPFGTPCSQSDVFQTSLCSDVPPCPANIDCTVSTSTIVASTSCNAVCGSGVKILWHSISTPQSGQGQGCDWGLLVQQEACEGPPCPATNSCNTNEEAWSAWGPCSAVCGSGTQYRTRAPRMPLDHCPLVQSQTCEGALPTCTSASGSSATCCPSTLVTGSSTTSCTLPTWPYLESLCYMQCAGMPFPTRSVDDNGIPFCDVTPDMLDVVCGTLPGQGACIEPRDCQLSPWSTWSTCSLPACDAGTPTGGVQVSTRSITAYAVGGGIPCSAFATTRAMPCNTLQSVSYLSVSSDATAPSTYSLTVLPPTCHPVNCSLSAWYPVGPCSAQCGTGTQLYAASITTLPQDGGTCDVNPGDFVKSEACDTGRVCGSCVFMSLSDYLAQAEAEGRDPWSTCSAQCDGEKTLTLPISVTAPPGGWCSYSDAIVRAPCCTGCVCEATCPLGVNGVACSGNGTCYSVSTATSQSVCAASGTCTSMTSTTWQYACSCSGNYSGVSCGVQCPIGLDGSACGSVSGFGTCGDNGKCTCSSGLSGPACNLGGYCIVTYEMPNAGAGSDYVAASIPLNSTYSNAVNQSSCFALAQALANTVGSQGMSPPINVTTTLSAAPGLDMRVPGQPSINLFFDPGPMPDSAIQNTNQSLNLLYNTGVGCVFPGVFSETPQLAQDQAPHVIVSPIGIPSYWV